MDYLEFVNGNKTLLIAPAGYGKTYAIAECLKYTVGHQLILTHTNAGITSINQKIKQAGIAPNTYSLETISGFVQKYATAFLVGKGIPEQEKSKEYHGFLLQKAIALLDSQTVREVIKSSYKGLFVDEYQDCSKGQHVLIMKLAELLPVHILGDPMQGIFDFNGESVDMNKDLGNFVTQLELEVPMRWYKDGNNKPLGDILKELRTALVNKSRITLKEDKGKGFYVFEIPDGDILSSGGQYLSHVTKIILNGKKDPDMDSLLILMPEYKEEKNGAIRLKGDITHRSKIKARIDVSQSLMLLEAMDDKSFYLAARQADKLLTKGIKQGSGIDKIREMILERFFAASNLNKWFKGEMFIRKSSIKDQWRSDKLKLLFDDFFSLPSAKKLAAILLEIRKGLKILSKRDEVFYSLVSALNKAELDNVPVYEAMKSYRNILRRTGRKVHGKCLGTTLLTKGLEFDSVVILDAHRFTCPKQFYVAITRCCKKLFIFTHKTTLSNILYAAEKV